MARISKAFNHETRMEIQTALLNFKTPACVVVCVFCLSTVVGNVPSPRVVTCCLKVRYRTDKECMYFVLCQNFVRKCKEFVFQGRLTFTCSKVECLKLLGHHSNYYHCCMQVF